MKGGLDVVVFAYHLVFHILALAWPPVFYLILLIP